MMDKDQYASKYYSGESGRHYTNTFQPNPDDLRYQIHLDYFLPHIKDTDKVLDFGCGNGGMMSLLKDKVALVEGLEINPHAAKVARKPGHVIYSKLTELPEVPVYDAVISNHVLEHVRDVSSTLERIRVSMKPGALLLLKLPMEDWRSRAQKKWDRNDVNHHLQTWTPRLIGNVLFEAGFDVDNIKIVTSAVHPRFYPLVKYGLGNLAFWLFSIIKKRRQMFVVGHVPDDR